VVIVGYDEPMKTCVQLMIDKNISSVLVIDDSNLIVGIITERDIVRKFTLLDLEDKLAKKAGAFMTRPVKFVRKDHLVKDILKLHFDLKVRHFPILTAKEATEENIAGMLSVTDILKFYLNEEMELNSDQPIKDTPMIKIAILTENRGTFDNFKSIFSQLRYEVDRIEEFNSHVKNGDIKIPLVFDLDSYTTTKLKNLTPAVLKYPGKLIVLTANPATFSAFKKYLNPKKQAVAIKPLDLSYINWLIREQWSDA
jgi:CBS domain-containing protein